MRLSVRSRRILDHVRTRLSDTVVISWVEADEEFVVEASGIRLSDRNGRLHRLRASNPHLNEAVRQLWVLLIDHRYVLLVEDEDGIRRRVKHVISSHDPQLGPFADVPAQPRVRTEADDLRRAAQIAAALERAELEDIEEEVLEAMERDLAAAATARSEDVVVEVDPVDALLLE